MGQNRLILTLALLMVTKLLCSQTIEDYKRSLPNLKGAERITALDNIYELSLDGGDLQEQWKYLNDYLTETRIQNNKREEAQAHIARMGWFFNNDLNDSILHYAEEDLSFLKQIEDWDKYYAAWSMIVNTYVYGGSLQTGLQEAQKMFDDAKNRNSTQGMGLAHYGMGNAYYNMNDLDNAKESYSKSITLLMSQKPIPEKLGEIFSSMCDLLEQKGDYRELNLLTVTWKKFLTRLFQEYAINPKEQSLQPLWAYYYIACAQADLGLGKLNHAADMLGQAREHIFSEEEYTYRSWLFFRSRLCLLQEFYPEALAFNTQRMKLLEGSDETSEILMTLQQRGLIMTKLGRYQEASQLYKDMFTISDSVNSYESKRQLAEMNTIWEVDEIKMKQARDQMRSIIIIASIIVIALIIFLFFRIRSAKRLRKAHNALEQAHGKLEETHQELLTAYDQLEETTAAKERIESDLRIAREIQMSMVPSSFPERPDLDLYASMTPAKEVGGDLYGYHLMDDQLYFCLGDVSGKGVPASLFMAQATRLFHTLAAQKLMPAEICNQINAALSGEDNEQSMFVTLFVGLVDLQTGHLDFCNGGHNPPVLIGDGTTEFIEMIPNCPIGLWPGMEYEGEVIDDISNRPLFVYTDGLNEAENREKKQFSDERLLEILQTTPFESCRQTVDLLKNEVEKHRDGAEPNDDLTMLCLKVIREKNN